MNVEIYIIGKKQCARVYHKKRLIFLHLQHLPSDPAAEVSLNETKDDSAQKKLVMEGESSSSPEILDPEKLSIKVLSKICLTNSIPLSWATNRFRSANCKATLVSLRLEKTKRKNKPISQEDFRKVYKELRFINRQSALIIKILWEVNKSLDEAGSYITLEALLRVKKSNVYYEGVLGRPHVCIGMIVFKKNIPCDTIHYIPYQILKFFLKQMNPTSPFVFSNKNGGLLNIVQVITDLKEAGRRAGLGEMTSLSLRPPPNAKRVARFKKKNIFSGIPKELLLPVTQDEWDVLSAKLPKKEKSGRKPVYRPLDIFNTILHCFSTGTSMKTLSPPFPPSSAVESQYRRWKKSGILDKWLNSLLAARRSNSTLT